MSKVFWRWTKDEVTSENSELIIEGEISSTTWFGDEATPAQLREELQGHNGDLTVHINSPGGDVWAGTAMFNALKKHNGSVTIVVDSLAASIASIIAMAGDKIIMAEGSMLYVHKPWTMVVGNSDEMIEAAKLLEKLGDNLVDIYVNRTGKSKDEVVAMLEGDGTWMTATEAVESGFADEAEGKKVNLSDTINNALKLAQPVRAAVMQPAMSLKSILDAKNEVEEANADTTETDVEAVEQTVEIETAVEVNTDTEATEVATEAEVTDAAEVKEPVKEEINAMNEIAKTQVMEPNAQAKVDAPVVNAKEWFKSKDAVEAFTMALANNAGKDFRSEEVQAAYKAAQIKAGIADPSVFTLPEPVISSIEDAVKSGEIYSRMNHTGLDVFKLVWDDTDANTDTSRAGGFNGLWEDGSSNIDRTKDEQVLDFENRVIRAQYIYKYLVLGKETVRENRSTGALVRFVLNELPVRIIRELERAAIIGDGRAAGNKRKITSFASVKADTAAGNAFGSTYVRVAGESLAEAVRRSVDLIEADGEVVLIAKKGFKTDAQFEKDVDGKLLFPIGTSAEAILGVNTIIEPSWFTDATDADNDAYLVVLGKYFTVGDNSVEAFTNFKLETNENEFLQEIYKGGALAAVKSAVAVSATVASS